MGKKNKKVGIEEAEERLLVKHNGKIKMSNFVGIKVRAHFICLVCGNEWDTKAECVITNGTGCPACSLAKSASARSLSSEDVELYIESRGCEWIDGKYTNNKSKLTIKFECGHIGTISYNAFRDGGGCRFCGMAKGHKSKRLSKEHIIEFVESHDFKFIEFVGEPKGRKSTIKYVCDQGHVSVRCFKDFYVHLSCETCKRIGIRNNLITEPDELFELVAKNGCELLEIIKYNNRSDSEVKIKFSCGHIKTMPFSNFSALSTSLCRECALGQYAGEKSNWWKGGITPINNYLRKIDKEYLRECAKSNGFRCVITGKPMGHVHHLQGFNLLVKETLDSLGILPKKFISDYTEDELNIITKKFIEIRKMYPNPVPLEKSIHIEFHKRYGRGNNTPDQWNDFVSLINLGEIVINN